MREILKATARYRENSFFFGKLLFVTLTSCNSNGHYAIALKFSAEQINLIKKKKLFAICEIMNINAKNTKTQMKLKLIFF